MIVENIRRIRSEKSLTIDDIAWNIYQATGEQWDKNRVYRLLSGHRGRSFKWAEVVTIAGALESSIFDVVLPPDQLDEPFNQLSRAFGMHPADLVASQRDATLRDARMRDNTGWALQCHPRVKAIWDDGKARAQEIAARGEIGADTVIEETRERAAAETRKIFYTAWSKQLESDTLVEMSNLQIDKEGAPSSYNEETALTILAELGMLDGTNDG